jgi:hypothetical protein
MRKLVGTFALSISLYAIVPCDANTIVAVNAGSTLATAEDLTGMYPTEIVGTLSGANPNDVSIFNIFNLQPTNFSAITVAPGAFGIPDTVLSLFKSSGVGIYLNDDISGANTLSCLSSSGAGNPCPTSGTTLPVGDYYLAISRSANYPVDGSNNEIFNPPSSTDLVGPSSLGPVAGWDDGSFTSPDTDLVSYDIILTGATAPEPASWLLTAMGAGFFLELLRRRRLVSKRG